MPPTKLYIRKILKKQPIFVFNNTGLVVIYYLSNESANISLLFTKYSIPEYTVKNKQIYNKISPIGMPTAAKKMLFKNRKIIDNI